MKTLTEYISENRKGISSVTTEDKWWGEMYSGMRAVFYDVPTVSAQKKYLLLSVIQRQKNRRMVIRQYYLYTAATAERFTKWLGSGRIEVS